MNILLFNSDFGDEGENTIMPLTMYSLGGVIRSKGHSIRVIDPGLYRGNFYDEDINELLKSIHYKYDVIAFSTNTFSWSRVRQHIINLREYRYKGKIVIGGVHPTRLVHHVLENADIDFVLLGEGEVSFPKLLDAIDGKIAIDDVPGVAYRSGDKIVQTEQANLIELTEEIPLPAYDLVPKGAYKMFTFESSRGCYGNCTFCSIIFKRCWRGFSEDIVLNRLIEVESIINDKIYDRALDFSDDYFTADIERAKGILNKLEKTKFKDYNFLIESRLKNLYDKELIAILKKFPNVNIQVGLESGYDEGLKKINKGIKHNDIIEVAKILYENNLNSKTIYSFIIGFPWESKEDILKTLKTVILLKAKYNMNVNCVWWLAMPSLEFDRLKEINSNVSEDIYNVVDWHKDKEIFYQTHPNISEEDLKEINKIVNICKDIGYEIRF